MFTKDGATGMSSMMRRRLFVTGAAALMMCAGTSWGQFSSDDLRPDGPPGVAENGHGETSQPTEDFDNESGELTSGVQVSEYMTVDIFVQDEQLSNVLQMLSLQSQRNIVASQDVSASVTANLYNVTFYDALDAILHVNGYGYIERGNFIYVYTLEEINTILAEDRNLVSRVIQLNYLNANDAAEFVTPLLSEKGVIKTNGDAGEFSLPADDPAGADEFALAATLVLFDYPEHVDEIVALLDQLDTRPAQVLVEATILQTQLTESNAFGVDFSFLDGAAFGDFFGLGGPLDVAQNLITGDFPATDDRTIGGGSTAGDTAGPGTLKLAVIDDDFAVFLKALDEVTDTQILSNPKILALNRQPARVLVGRKIGYLSTTSTETSTTQTVEFLDTGTQLSFRPFISKDNMVRLELKPRVSEGVVRTATDATGAAVTIPDEITQEITTNVIIPDGSTVVLGGLFRESTTLGRKQVPILGDIPLLGTAFRGHDDSTDRVEIIFMVKPTIMNDQTMLAQGERGMDTVDDVRAGSRNGTLPWSRDKQTAQLNVKAERLAAQGETDKALWNIRRSLELNPTQPAAIRMRERLLNGDGSDWPTRSLLDRIVVGEVDSVTGPFDYVTTSNDATPATSAWQSQPMGPVASDAEQSTQNSQWITDVDPSMSQVDTVNGFSGIVPTWIAQRFFGPGTFVPIDEPSDATLTDVPVDPDE